MRLISRERNEPASVAVSFVTGHERCRAIVVNNGVRTDEI